eukprot:sb/3462766/
MLNYPLLIGRQRRVRRVSGGLEHNKYHPEHHPDSGVRLPVEIQAGTTWNYPSLPKRQTRMVGVRGCAVTSVLLTGCLTTGLTRPGFAISPTLDLGFSTVLVVLGPLFSTDPRIDRRSSGLGLSVTFFKSDRRDRAGLDGAPVGGLDEVLTVFGADDVTEETRGFFTGPIFVSNLGFVSTGLVLAAIGFDFTSPLFSAGCGARGDGRVLGGALGGARGDMATLARAGDAGKRARGDSGTVLTGLLGGVAGTLFGSDFTGVIRPSNDWDFLGVPGRGLMGPREEEWRWGRGLGGIQGCLISPTEGRETCCDNLTGHLPLQDLGTGLPGTFTGVETFSRKAENASVLGTSPSNLIRDLPTTALLVMLLLLLVYLSLTRIEAGFSETQGAGGGSLTTVPSSVAIPKSTTFDISMETKKADKNKDKNKNKGTTTVAGTEELGTEPPANITLSQNKEMNTTSGGEVKATTEIQVNTTPPGIVNITSSKIGNTITQTPVNTATEAQLNTTTEAQLNTTTTEIQLDATTQKSVNTKKQKKIADTTTEAQLKTTTAGVQLDTSAAAEDTTTMMVNPGIVVTTEAPDTAINNTVEQPTEELGESTTSGSVGGDDGGVNSTTGAGDLASNAVGNYTTRGWQQDKNTVGPSTTDEQEEGGGEDTAQDPVHEELGKAK